MGKRPVSSLASCHGSSPFEERRFPHPAVDSEESSAVRDDRVASVQGALHLALLATQSPARHFASLDHHRLFLRQIHPIRLHHAITRQTQVPRSKVKPRNQGQRSNPGTQHFRGHETLGPGFRMIRVSGPDP